MNKRELLNILEDVDDDAKIFLISQPMRHSLVYGISAWYSGAAGNDDVYLVEGSQVGYLDSEVREELNLHCPLTKAANQYTLESRSREDNHERQTVCNRFDKVVQRKRA